MEKPGSLSKTSLKSFIFCENSCSSFFLKCLPFRELIKKFCSFVSESFKLIKVLFKTPGTSINLNQRENLLNATYDQDLHPFSSKKI